MKTASLLITFDQLDAAQPRPMGNREHAEAFMRKRYNIALQLALIDQTGLSQRAIDNFPLILNRDFSFPSLCEWSLRFETWRQTLSRADRSRFNSMPFNP